MCIIRTSHDKNKPYVTLNKTALEEKKLSFAAKGLWSYLLSRPDNWNISVAHLVNEFGEAGSRGQKRDFIYSLIKELTSFGYVTRYQEKNNGRFSKSEYVIHESPVGLNKSLPNTAEADPVDADSAQTTLISNEYKQVMNSKEFVCSPSVTTTASPTSPPSGVENSSVLRLTDFKGLQSTIAKNDVHSFALRTKRDWTVQEIEFAWLQMSKRTKIADPMEFIAGTIKNIRVKEYNNKMSKKAQKDKSCQSIKDSSQSKLPQNIIKDSSSKKDTPKLLFHDWKAELASMKNSSSL